MICDISMIDNEKRSTIADAPSWGRRWNRLETNEDYSAAVARSMRFSNTALYIDIA